MEGTCLAPSSNWPAAEIDCGYGNRAIGEDLRPPELVLRGDPPVETDHA